jgi:hypothetical protein
MSATTVPNPGRALVQGKTHQGPIPRRHGGMARPDARCIRVRGHSVKYAADQPRIWRSADRSRRKLRRNSVGARRRHSAGWIAGRKVPTPDLEMIK